MKNLSVKELILRFEQAQLSMEELQLRFEQTPLKSLGRFIEKELRKEREKRALEEDYHCRNAHEDEHRKRGYTLIAGLDEVGRGPLAGPVVCAAVILNPEDPILGIRDSKKLSEKKREALAEEIKQRALDYSIAVVDEKTIDEINILQATRLCMLKAVRGLRLVPDALFIDALGIDCEIYQFSLNQGDDICNCIGAASIIAKVFRDHLMQDYDEEYPGYCFSTNKGYGTKEHLEALRQLGPCAIHRRSFIGGR